MWKFSHPASLIWDWIDCGGAGAHELGLQNIAFQMPARGLSVHLSSVYTLWGMVWKNVFLIFGGKSIFHAFEEATTHCQFYKLAAESPVVDKMRMLYKLLLKIGQKLHLMFIAVRCAMFMWGPSGEMLLSKLSSECAEWKHNRVKLSQVFKDSKICLSPGRYFCFGNWRHLWSR